MAYMSDAPFVLRDFSDGLHQTLQNEIGRDDKIFGGRRLGPDALQDLLEEHVFAGFRLCFDTRSHQRRLVLEREAGDSSALQYLSWSAGQRRIMPLLLALSWLLSPSRTARRKGVDWVVIEEPEAGLHPEAISAVTALVMELRLRGYRVCISTHSANVLDAVWALQFCQDHGGLIGDVLRLFCLPSTTHTRKLARAALETAFRTYYFRRNGTVQDISSLDPGSEDIAVASWGGVTESSGDPGAVVCTVSNRYQVRQFRASRR